MSKYKGKYRIDSARLRNWDYGWNAYYFVTIVTKNRTKFFGNVVDKKMQLSSMGKIAKKCWIEIPEHFPFVKLGAFVIMPNHVHGIIHIDKKFEDTQDFPFVVETQNLASLQQPTKNKFGPQSKNLGSIVRGFKIGVTKNSRKINPDFAWQPRYHDHIVRDEKSYVRISHYILNNPKNWDDDTFY